MWYESCERTHARTRARTHAYTAACGPTQATADEPPCSPPAHAGPEFTWSTISVSKTTKYGAHIDTQNLEGSLSAIFCLGEHRGGDLAVYNPSSKEWTSLDARGQWRMWDGKMPHYTRAFRGERFSIVFYTHRQCFRLPAEERRALAALGFRYPSQASSGGDGGSGGGGPGGDGDTDTAARAQALMAEALAALRVRGVGGEGTKSDASEDGVEAEASGVAFPGMAMVVESAIPPRAKQPLKLAHFPTAIPR